MPFPASLPSITFLHRPLYVVAAGSEGGPFHKLFQLRLRSGPDPRLAVDFTYSPFGSGLASRFLSQTPEAGSETFDWLDPAATKRTSHQPKYSHHRDGRAHFSQDGKILTSVRRQACPLRAVNGHAFTIYIQGVTKFPQLNDKDAAEYEKGKRNYIHLTTTGSAADMV